MVVTFVRKKKIVTNFRDHVVTVDVLLACSEGVLFVCLFVCLSVGLFVLFSFSFFFFFFYWANTFFCG